MEVNRFHFTQIKGEPETEVMLDLSEFTCQTWWELGLLQLFEVEILQGTKLETVGRVRYDFRLSNEIAHVLKSAIFVVVQQLNSQLN